MTNEDGSGGNKTGTALDRDVIEIPREDVARTLIAMLETENTYEEKFELAAGEKLVDESLEVSLHS
ncbi:Rossmann-fold NAD(P)-binding domain-containing protein [Halorubrum coriense]|uniref:hypothetical protein n=1 Tax=Halorubrum coriense TaxID=64713 RepID=UPI001269598A|nr:hypothetical protein [Halorubrum coriense]